MLQRNIVVSPSQKQGSLTVSPEGTLLDRARALLTIKGPMLYCELIHLLTRGATPRRKNGYPDTDITHCKRCNFNFDPDDSLVYHHALGGLIHDKKLCRGPNVAVSPTPVVYRA